MKRSGVASVRLSHLVRQSRRAAGLLLWAPRAGDNDRLLHGAYPQQHGSQQQMRAVSRLQRRRRLNTDLFITKMNNAQRDFCNTS